MERFRSNTEDQWPERKKKWFESTAAQSLILFAAMAGSMVGIDYEKHYQEKQQIQEVQKEGFNLEKMSKKFDVKVVIPSEKHSVIHIKQIHKYGTLKEMEADGTATKVIQNQKEMEVLLEHLSQENGIRDFYDERVAVDKNGKSEGLELLKMLRDILNNKVMNPNVSVVESADALVDLETLVETPHEFDGPDGRKAEGANAEALYAIKIGWDTLIKNINAAEIAEQEGHGASVPKKYDQFIKSATKAGMFKELVDGFQSDRSQVAKDPLIQGDNIYVMGADKKLYIEGKINIIPAETEEGNDNNAKAAASVVTPDSDQTFQEAVNEREDIAVERMTKDPNFKNKKFTPIIFGAKHQFGDNIERYNRSHPSSPIGLIEIASK